MHICMYIYMHTHMYIYVYLYLYVHIFIYIYIYIYLECTFASVSRSRTLLCPLTTSFSSSRSLLSSAKFCASRDKTFNRARSSFFPPPSLPAAPLFMTRSVRSSRRACEYKVHTSHVCGSTSLYVCGSISSMHMGP